MARYEARDWEDYLRGSSDNPMCGGSRGSKVARLSIDERLERILNARVCTRKAHQKN